MDTNRLEAFSDGVFAIAITLLILEIKVPHSGSPLGAELLGLWPSYLAYVTSFIVIGAIWINHHSMFQSIVRVDHKLLLLNTLHLMFELPSGYRAPTAARDNRTVGGDL